MRYKCGSMLAKRDGDSVHPDIVAGVPDSGIAHAIGYSNESGIPYARPFIKYTPTWPRSFMPTSQSQRNLIAKMKLIPVQSLIEDKKLLLIDDLSCAERSFGRRRNFSIRAERKKCTYVRRVRRLCTVVRFLKFFKIQIRS